MSGHGHQWDNPGWTASPSYDPRDPEFNPGGTLPFPAPKNAPVGFWSSGSAVSLNTWAPPAVALDNGAVVAARWTSPIFDLRPDLRAVTGEHNAAQPIWRANMGAGGSLFVQVGRLTSLNNATVDLRVLSAESAHPTNPNALARVAPLQDITTEFTNGTPSALLVFRPPGEGFPVRFWNVRLTFVFKAAHAAYPTYSLNAAYY